MCAYRIGRREERKVAILLNDISERRRVQAGLERSSPGTNGEATASGFRGKRWGGSLTYSIARTKNAEDKARAKDMGARQFIEKPASARGFGEVVQGLRETWLSERR